MAPQFIAFGFCIAATAAVAGEFQLHTFQKARLNDHFWAEGATYGDFNRDDQMDIVCGPFWYEGPAFTKRHEYASATTTFKRKNNDGTEEVIPGFEGVLGLNNAYSKNFFAFTFDFNKDGWSDILIIGFPGEETAWYENPKGIEGQWPRHVVFQPTDNESPTFINLVGDDRPELVCNSGGFLGYAAPDWNDPARPWVFHPVSPKGDWQRFTHGLGVGDVNGDGRADILEKGGWWEQPASLAADPVWRFHPVNFGSGGAQMFAYDVNGDGLNDVITSLAAHGYGLAWFEQIRTGDDITFREHVFMNKQPADNKYGVCFSQLHALDLADMDGDGLKDIITGKRFWAHGATGDPEPNAPAVLYWFKLVRHGDKSVDFVPQLIDIDSGVGTQVVTGDVNGDKLLDVVVGNKKGAFVLLHTTKNVTEAEWRRAQPQPRMNQSSRETN